MMHTKAVSISSFVTTFMVKRQNLHVDRTWSSFNNTENTSIITEYSVLCGICWFQYLAETWPDRCLAHIIRRWSHSSVLLVYYSSKLDCLINTRTEINECQLYSHLLYQCHLLIFHAYHSLVWALWLCCCTEESCRCRQCIHYMLHFAASKKTL